jgi:hypothetical protein
MQRRLVSANGRKKCVDRQLRLFLLKVTMSVAGPSRASAAVTPEAQSRRLEVDLHDAQVHWTRFNFTRSM